MVTKQYDALQTCKCKSHSNYVCAKFSNICTPDVICYCKYNIVIHYVVLTIANNIRISVQLFAIKSTNLCTY